MREPGLLKPAVLWLLLLAPLFFSTYGFATWVTSQRSDVGTLVFGWETHMPFWAWTIVPYWSIDLLYGFSLLLPNSRHELKQHALRLLSAQVIAVSCFLIWPLRFITITLPGGTSFGSSSVRSNTVMSGARSEAKAMTSSFWKYQQGRMPDGSRATKASPLPMSPQRV